MEFDQLQDFPYEQGQNQHWRIGKSDSSGYFPIKHDRSNRFLTAVSAKKLTIESMGLINNISPT